MFQQRFISAFLALLIVYSLGSSIAFAQDKKETAKNTAVMNIPSIQRLERMVNRLQLNEEEKTAVGKIFEDAKPDNKKYLDAMQENQKQISALLQTEAPDAEAIRALADVQGKIHADSLFARIDLLTKVRGALNDNQRAALNKRLQRNRGRDRIKQRDQERKRRREQRAKRRAQGEKKAKETHPHPHPNPQSN